MRGCWRATRSSASSRTTTASRWSCGDVDSGDEHTRRARYLVAADGAHSTVRDLLGIPVDGRGVFSNSITIYFTADLWPQMGGKPLSVIYINNPVFGGFFRLAKDCQSGFLVVNTVGDPDSDPDVANAARDTSEARLDRARACRRGRPRPRGQDRRRRPLAGHLGRRRAVTTTAACSWPATPPT